MRIHKLRPRLLLVGWMLCCYAVGSLAIEKAAAASMTLKSPDFSDQNSMPKKFTCDGSNVSPSLTWSGVPKNAKSLALIVEDPDVPAPFLPFRTWVHWLLYNIPPTATGLAQYIAAPDLPKGARQGKNDWQEAGYKGPCPPFARHRYFFKLYALDTNLPNLDEPDKAELVKAMKGHIIDQSELMGTYKR